MSLGVHLAIRIYENPLAIDSGVKAERGSALKQNIAKNEQALVSRMEKTFESVLTPGFKVKFDEPAGLIVDGKFSVGERVYGTEELFDLFDKLVKKANPRRSDSPTGSAKSVRARSPKVAAKLNLELYLAEVEDKDGNIFYLSPPAKKMQKKRRSPKTTPTGAKKKATSPTKKKAASPTKKKVASPAKKKKVASPTKKKVASPTKKKVASPTKKKVV